jgi:hypothetical protein
VGQSQITKPHKDNLQFEHVTQNWTNWRNIYTHTHTHTGIRDFHKILINIMIYYHDNN